MLLESPSRPSSWLRRQYRAVFFRFDIVSRPPLGQTVQSIVIPQYPERPEMSSPLGTHLSLLKLQFRQCAIAINFFLKIVNNVQYFSPFRTYFTIHISFFLKFIVHFYRPLTALPFFAETLRPFRSFFNHFWQNSRKNRENIP